MARLATGLRALDVELLNEPDVNMVFARLEPAAADRMADAGLLFYRMTTDTIRLVTSFQTTDEEVDEALSRIKIALVGLTFWLARPTRFPSLSVMKAIHSSAPAGPNTPLSSVKITCGSLVMGTPSARSCSTVDAHVVDPQVDQRRRGGALEQQSSVAEAEERQSRRIEDRCRRRTEQPAVELHRTIEIVARAVQPDAGSWRDIPRFARGPLADPHREEHEGGANTISKMKMLADDQPREDDTEQRCEEHRDRDSVGWLIRQHDAQQEIGDARADPQKDRRAQRLGRDRFAAACLR